MISKKIRLTAIALMFCVPVLSHALSRMEINSYNTGDILGKVWKLDEVRTGQNPVKIARTAGENQLYSLIFEAERINGVAAPNRYFGPWKGGEANAISIGMVGSTMMATLFERADLKEQEYFNYLGKVYKWELRNGKLELHTRNEGNAEVTLVYSE